MQRVLESQAFCKAPAMCAFLRYITSQMDLGLADQLKEQTIGVEVLGRRPNYDPAKDNIVRVRANELRGRLARYFASEGIKEPVVITIPRGGYAPDFVPREVLLLDATEKTQGPPEAPAGDKPSQGRLWSFVTLSAVIVVASSYLVITRYRAKSAPSQGSINAFSPLRDFWTQFFTKPNGPLTIIYSDADIALWQRLNNRDLNLGDYLSHKYLVGDNNELLEIASQRASSPADTNTSLHIQDVAAGIGGQVNAVFARNVNAELLQRRNLVLLGSRRSNPWVEVYEPSLNFQLRIDPKTQSPAFFNRSPERHESLMYGIPDLRGTRKTADGQFIAEAEEKEFESYGVVALLKSCGTSHVVLLIEGLNLQATQAAGDLVTDPQLLGRLLESIGHKPGSNVAPFEVLFQVTSLPGGYDNPGVVASRIRPAEACINN